MEEKRYEEMSNVELMGVIAEKDSVIDGLVDKLKRNETSLLGKNEIMEVYHCQSNKALQILKHMMMCKFAVRSGKSITARRRITQNSYHKCQAKKYSYNV